MSKLEAKFGKNHVSLYRDDGLAILKAIDKPDQPIKRGHWFQDNSRGEP